MNVKITISSENRIVMIPMNYDETNDVLSFDETQIEPIPEKDEDVSKDLVIQLTTIILSTLRELQENE
jgi:chemotaxis signal transduction protein